MAYCKLSTVTVPAWRRGHVSFRFPFCFCLAFVYCSIISCLHFTLSVVFFPSSLAQDSDKRALNKSFSGHCVTVPNYITVSKKKPINKKVHIEVQTYIGI